MNLYEKDSIRHGLYTVTYFVVVPWILYSNPYSLAFEVWHNTCICMYGYYGCRNSFKFKTAPRAQTGVPSTSLTGTAQAPCDHTQARKIT